MSDKADWADGVLEVVNLQSRVYSQWVNGNENFFYRGDARALNEAIKQFAAVKDDGRRLILLPGTGRTHSFESKPVAFDWQLHVPSGIYKAVSKRTHVEITVYINAKKPRETTARQTVENWLTNLSDEQFETRDKATQELEKMGNNAKPYLRAALKGQPAAEARRRIEGLLAKLRHVDVTDLEIPKGVTIVGVDDLLAQSMRGLKDADSTVRGMALQDLSGFSAYSDKVVPTLIEMLGKDQNEWVRRVAAGCLSHEGLRPKSAIPALKAGLDDPDANIRNAFQAALDVIEKAKEKAETDEELKKKQSILEEIMEFKKAAAKKQ
jgi:hypothetical protein